MQGCWLHFVYTDWIPTLLTSPMSSKWQNTIVCQYKVWIYFSATDWSIVVSQKGNQRQTGKLKQIHIHTERISISVIHPGVITAKCLCNWSLPELPLRPGPLTSAALPAITFIKNINTTIRSSVITRMPICPEIPLLAISYRPADKLNWHRLERMFT